MSVPRGRAPRGRAKKDRYNSKLKKKKNGIYSSVIPVLFWFPQFEPFGTDVDIIHNVGKSCKV